MTDSTKPPIVPPQDTDLDDTDELPEHEIDREPTVGGGVMQTGGTSIDRGTGTLGGQAQGPVEDDDRDDPLEPEGVNDDQVMPNPQMQD